MKYLWYICVCVHVLVRERPVYLSPVFFFTNYIVAARFYMKGPKNVQDDSSNIPNCHNSKWTINISRRDFPRRHGKAAAA